jgi:capsular polysaccharide transport system permease protein
MSVFLTLSKRRSVIEALLLREMATRYQGAALGYFWGLAQPLGAILILTAAFSLMIRSPPLGTSFAYFFASGVLLFRFYETVSSMTASAISQNKSLLLFPSVTKLDTVIARLILQFLTACVAGVLIITSIRLLYGVNTPIDAAPILLAIVYSSLIGLGTGLINIVLFNWIKWWSIVWGVISGPLYLVSGIIFIPEILPPKMAYFASWNPLIHVVALGRRGFFQTYDAKFVDLFYLSWFTAIVLVIGLWLFTFYTEDE